MDCITLPQTPTNSSDEATTACLETYPVPSATAWTLQSKSCGNTAPQKELSQTTGLISKTISSPPGPKSTASSGYITSPLMHSLCENLAIQWPANNCTESNGC